tara:strand:- start:7306 stop:7926 length:621 start_codon:yes stop_codon:yes gene_type:complete
MTTVPVMTYDSLVADVQNYMERDDPQFVAQIPSLIYLAEQSLAAEIKTLQQLTVVEVTVLTGQFILQKPALWKKTISVKANGQPIVKRTQDYLAQFTAESSTGTVQYYAEYDYDNFMLSPTPSANTSIELTYYGLVQPLNTDNQQNLITREIPQALLFGTLLQAQGYLKAIDKLAVWKQYYTDAISAIKNEDKLRSIDRNTVAMEP